MSEVSLNRLNIIMLNIDNCIFTAIADATFLYINSAEEGDQTNPKATTVLLL